MTELFPMIQPPAERMQDERTLPLYREAAWDFAKRNPLFRAGNPVYLEGAAAVKTWIWKALVTERARYEIYSWDFGSELESLIGQPYTDELKRAEAVRYVRETLEINPYITSTAGVSVSFSDGMMQISAQIGTVYGEVSVHV